MAEPNGYDEGSEEGSQEPSPTLWQRVGGAARSSASAAAAGAVAAVTGVRDGAEALRDRWHKGAHAADKWAANGMVSGWPPRRSGVVGWVVAAGGALAQAGARAAWCDAPVCVLQVGRAFQFKQRNAKLCTELRAGLITFLMASAGPAARLPALPRPPWSCSPSRAGGQQ